MSADEHPAVAGASTEAIDGSSSNEAERSEKILKAKELYSRGSRNYLVKSYAESADELSMVCELYQELHGELSDELGMPYLLYAKSLIALALDENKIIDVPDEEEDDDDEEEEEDDVDASMALDEEAAGASATDEAYAANGKSSNGAAASKTNTINKAEAVDVAALSVDETKKGTADVDDEADSTAESASAAQNIVSDSAQKQTTDEAMVTSTEDAATTAANKNGDNSSLSNGSAADLVDADKPSTSNGATDTACATIDEDDEENETASTLQLAWEILELAAKIFERQGFSGLPNLAEVQTELANIEFENNILEAAREDYEKALKIYSELPTNYRRAMAEIHYKIGLTYLMQQLNKEGAAALKEACQLIEEEINEMRGKEEPSEKDKNVIQDMEETKEEILVKIGEIEEAQAQQIAEVRAALNKVIKPAGSDNADGAGPSSSADASIIGATTSSSSAAAAAITSSTKPTDISHLIKRKKPEEPTSEAEAAKASPAKRPAV